MQMVRLNITKRNSPAVTKPVEGESLDEKIRRIQEENKKRERRFQEIEQDKKLASDAVSTNKESDTHNAISNKRNIDTSAESKEHQKTSMKGVQEPYRHKKTSKGRGQRLLEMSHQPLKAEHFETRTNGLEHLSKKITLKNKCRTKMRERIKTTNKECGDTQSEVENEQKGLDYALKDQCHEVSKENENMMQQTKEGDLITSELKDIKSPGVKHREIETHKEDTGGDIVPCETTQATNIETDNILDNVKSQEHVLHYQKNDNKPKITVKLKKTVSSSSFDESMAMLSPLDLPQNWGDLDFSDDDLPSVSLWKE